MKTPEILVVGGGHAGVEAALAIARKKFQFFWLQWMLIQLEECPATLPGGLAKGHLVREIDALGGIMGEAAIRLLFNLKP